MAKAKGADELTDSDRREMATLDARISDLEEEIKGYVTGLKTASAAEGSDLRGLIKIRTETLNRLLDEKARSEGKLSILL